MKASQQSERGYLRLVGISMVVVMLGASQSVRGAGNLRVEKAGEWLRGQQNPVTGLLRSYDMPGDYMAWTYDQAVGIIAFLDINDINAAVRCGDGMLAVRVQCIEGPDNVWADGYNSVDGTQGAAAIAAGPNAWMGLAMLRLYGATGQERFLSAAEDVAAFLLARQMEGGCGDGAITGGYGQSCKLFEWTSTEHNVDALAFLMALSEVAESGADDYRAAGVKVGEWLHEEMWDANGGYYYPGYANNMDCSLSDFPERLDSQTWTLLGYQTMLCIESNDANLTDFIHDGLTWIDANAREVNYADCNLIGFSKVTLGDRATDSFWAEGTGGYILAAGVACHNREYQEAMLDSLRCLQEDDGSVAYSVGISCTDVLSYFDPCDIILAHFEGHPHCLYGNVGVYGDGEPDWEAIEANGFNEPYSWYYEPDRPGYDVNNVHSCWQSFRLVNATDMCKHQDLGWASFGLDLGPEVNGVIEAIDVSDYGEFSFWAKTEIDDANLQVLFGDANWTWPGGQAQFRTDSYILDTNWTEYTVELSEISGVNGLDLSELEHVAFAFGAGVGNSKGTIIYIDDVGFKGSDGMTPLSNGGEMPPTFPQHWPYGSVASTGWLIFVELGRNPFAVNCVNPPTVLITSASDLKPDCWVDFYDFTVLAAQWLEEPGNPSADLAPEGGDNMVNLLDLAVIAQRWLQYGD